MKKRIRKKIEKRVAPLLKTMAESTYPYLYPSPLWQACSLDTNKDTNKLTVEEYDKLIAFLEEMGKPIWNIVKQEKKE